MNLILTLLKKHGQRLKLPERELTSGVHLADNLQNRIGHLSGGGSATHIRRQNAIGADLFNRGYEA